MKNLITFLLYCLSVTALIAQAQSETKLTIVESGITETTLRLDLKGYDQTEVQTPQGQALVIGIQNGTPLLEKGAPDVPKFSASLLIPNKGNMAVEIISGEYDDYPDIAVAPSKGNLLRTVNPANIPFEYGPEYTRDQFFPGRLADLQNPFILRQVRGQALWIYPVQYNPVQRTLRVYRSITLRVHYVGGNGKNELTGGPVHAESRAFSQMYRQLFVNHQINADNRGGTQEPDKMLVIAADNLLDELQPLVTWKRQMGIHTTVVPMSEIGSTESSAVYNFAKTYYAQHGISYLLLVGDEDAIEPEMRASGAMYSCDNCFGYMSGDDHFPEVLVGRLHATTPEQLRIMVNRNLEYEINPLIDSTQNWMATGMASTSNEGEGIGDDNQADWEHGNEWKTAHLADGFEKYWEFYDGDHSADSPTPGDLTADKIGNPTNVPLVELMNTRGVSLYNYTGHGWEQGLVSGNFTNTAVSNLRNSGRYPILIAVACCAGNFTNGECLGEAWQRAGDTSTGEPYGGIAGFFSSDYQSWSPPMEGQDGMNQYLADADGLLLNPTIGGMLAYGNARMIAAYNQGGELMADFWNPFAEPSTTPRTALPMILSAVHTDSTAFETTSLLVSCPVEGAQISLFWQDQTWAVATVVNGMAELIFSPLNNTGEIILTATQFNYIPYQSSIVVKPASQPFVVSQEISLDDSANGNNNQKADYGETVALDVLLKNIGLGTATAVAASISSDNPYVSITSGQVTIGDLGSNLMIPANFEFTVSDAVPNGSKADFVLTLTYNDALQYSTTIPVTLYAPVLEIGAWTLDDATQGNGNKRLESGEVVRIHILNRNIGGSDCPKSLGTLTSLSPYLQVSGTAILGPLNAATGEESIFFLVTVSPNAPPSVSAELHYELRTPNGNYQTEKTIGPLIINAIVETFETNNFSSFNWQMSGNKPWITTTAGAYAGQYCSRSGTITHSQQSTMELQLLVLEDGFVSFARSVSSEPDFDFLRFYIDGEETGAWSGNVPWSEVSYPVSAGLHSLTWTYAKDDLVSSGTDRAWVDEIMLPPHQIVVGTHTQNALPLEMNIAPNPSDGWFTMQLEVPEEQLMGIDVYDGLGRFVQTVQPASRRSAGPLSAAIDLRAAPPGVYLVQVRGSKNSAVAKVVVW